MRLDKISRAGRTPLSSGHEFKSRSALSYLFGSTMTSSRLPMIFIPMHLVPLPNCFSKQSMHILDLLPALLPTEKGLQFRQPILIMVWLLIKFTLSLTANYKLGLVKSYSRFDRRFGRRKIKYFYSSLSAVSVVTSTRAGGWEPWPLNTQCPFLSRSY